jgi:CheY-like chemotaxis protein/HPt (histidine-containing phosphotransfer) domain-containing protein
MEVLTGHILLAEDGQDNQVLLTHVLSRAGATVTVVENGQLALEQALAARDRGEPFGLVLMDMQMPVMDGYQATQLLRQRGYLGPIVALTAHALSSDREKCIQAGCDDYAAKPIDRRQLVQIAARHLAQSQATGQPTGQPLAAGLDEQLSAKVPLLSEFAQDPGMQEVIDWFVERLPERMQSMRAAASQGDRQSLRRLAHQLKGAASGYGYPSITHVAAELERTAQDSVTGQGETAQWKSCLEQLSSLCQLAQAGWKPAGTKLEPTA